MSDFFTSRFTTINNFFQTQHFVWADLRHIFSWDYWIEANIPPQTPYFLVSLLVTIIAILLLFFWRHRLKAANKIIPVYEAPTNQLANIIAFIITIVISYAFFRAQTIAYLSSRLVILAGLLIIISWLGWTVFYLWRVAPMKCHEYLERERFFRYIPKKKEKSPGKNKNK